MNKNDDNILNHISDELNNSDDIALPKKLQKEEIAKMLKEKENSGEIAAMQKQGKKQKQLRYFKSIAYAAAVFIVLFGSVKAFDAGKIYIGNRFENEKTTNGDNSKKGETPQNNDNKTAKPLPDFIKTPSSYEEVENIFLNLSRKAKRPSFDDIKNIFGGAVKEDAAIDMDEDSHSSGDNESVRGHAKTNLQVEGVDEADIIKTDGTYIYKVYYESAEKQKRAFIENDSDSVMYDVDYMGDISGFQIIKAYPAKDMEVVSGTLIHSSDLIKNLKNLSSSSANVIEMYLQGNTLYVIVNEYAYLQDGENYQNKSITSVFVYDISNKAEPKLQKTFSQEGDYISSRLTNNRLIVLTRYGVNLYQNNEYVKSSCIPNFYIDENEEKIAENNILMIDGIESSEYLVLSNINLKDLDEKPVFKAVLGGANDSYCTKDTLYVPNVVYDYSQNRILAGRREIFADIAILPANSYTEIFCFDITNGIDFIANGRVPGQPLNQFAMDEYNGYFRIATTDTKGNKTSNNVYVMDNNFKIIGKIEGLAMGESIQSVRFMGDTAYVVTFFRTDPLFVIDMSNPENPEVLGELKIPGFSQYLHPVGDGLLVGVGVSGDENGQTDGVKISLFDVKDPKQPKEIDKLEIPNSYLPSTSHKAFLSIDEKDLYAIPINSYFYNGINGLYSFKLEGDSLKFNKAYQNEKGNTYSPYDRGTYIGDAIYYVTAYKTSAFSIDSGEMIAEIK